MPLFTYYNGLHKFYDVINCTYNLVYQVRLALVCTRLHIVKLAYTHILKSKKIWKAVSRQESHIQFPRFWISRKITNKFFRRILETNQMPLFTYYNGLHKFYDVINCTYNLVYQVRLALVCTRLHIVKLAYTHILRQKQNRQAILRH